MTARHDLDRRLRAADRAHEAALPAWRRLLARALDDDGGLTTDEKASLLGVATRRQVLRVGGLAIAGSAVLAACGGDDGGDDARTERPSPTTQPTGPGGPPGPELDVVLANTALSLEVLAVDTYQVGLDVGLVQTAPVREAVLMFQAHHAAHRDALIAVVQAAGVEPFTTANPVVKAAFVDPALYSAAGEGDLVRLARDVEQAAAQTYVYAAGTLSTAELRWQAMSIGGVEARHAAVLDAIGELSDEQPARYPSTNPLPRDAMVVD